MILVGGEALIDLTPARVDGRDVLVPHPGGSPMNVAVGLARLEVPVAFLSRLSTDTWGRRLRRHLEDEGVDLSLTGSGEEPTALAIVDLPPDAEPEYDFRWDGTADRLLAAAPELPADVTIVHTGSVSLLLEPAASAYVALAQRAHGRCLTTMDPNVRPSFIPDRAAYLAQLHGWLSHTDVVKVSAADLAWLVPGRSPDDIAREWAERGAALVVVTLGGDGALGVTVTGHAEVPPVAVTVVDTVGAGDAFTSGLLATLHGWDVTSRASVEALTSDEVAAAIARAAEVAAVTCGRAGADPPRRGDLSEAWRRDDR